MRNSVSKIKINTVLGNKDKYSSEFSEENQLIKLCLLDLWSNEIYTVGCCIGHEEKEDSASYVGIDLINSNMNNVINLLNNVDKSEIRLAFIFGNCNSTCSLRSLKK